ncbi:class I SAM-dependent methyltransferase [Marivita sp. S0852]|uniref:class I SAM-dependent methyltransferase n=1 Tax=Marivita sp. S0852 TaxID=3373893 RepID=UPI003981C00E
MYDSAKFWDKTADKYAAMPVRNQDAYDALLDQVRAFAAPDSTVLELGCGTGSTAIALAPSFDHIVATDVSSGMLEKGREKAQDQQVGNVEFVLADPTDAPAGPFDVVLAFNLLHLLKDLDGALSEIAARLKPEGVFVSKTFCMPERRDLIWALITVGLPLMQAIGKAPFFAKLSAADLENAFTRAGLTIVENHKAPGKDPRRTIVARRSE